MLSSDEFWHYSLQVYSKPGVKERCLNLQNSAQLNVNLLLLCGYLTVQKLRLSRAQFVTLRAAISELDRHTQDLRRQRRVAKTSDPQRYQALLRQELEYERKQQVELIRAVNGLNIEVQQRDNFSAYQDGVMAKGDLKSHKWLKELQAQITDEIN